MKRGARVPAALAALLAPAAIAAAGEAPPALVHTAAGLTATLALTGADGGVPRAGEVASLRLGFSTDSGDPARGLRPAAWGERASVHAAECRERVRGLVQARLGRQAELDFNAWHLAVLGDNGAVYALDPVGGNARTRLLAVVNLGGRVAGFAEDPGRETFYAALPDTGEVAEIDARRWAERRRIAVGGRPARLALDASGAHLWVGQDGRDGATAQVALVERATGSVVARHEAGPGPHALAAAGAGLAASASPSGVSLLRAGTEARPLPGLGGGFAEAVWSPLAELVLLLDRGEGKAVAVRPDGRPVASWHVAPGAAGLFLDPTGRLLMVPEPDERRVTVVDLGRGAVAHRIALEGRPRRVGFSRAQAYVQHEEGGRLSLIALNSLVEGGRPAVATIAAGDGGLGAADDALGATVATAPGDGAMLIASPEDRVAHVYMEGMAAPSGALRLPPQARPLAIAAIDRGLREVAPGRYEAQAVFPAGGRWVVPVMQQGGGFLHCFEFEVAGDAVPLTRRMRLQLAAPQGRAVASGGAAVAVRVRLAGPDGEDRWRAAGDVLGRFVQFAGHWQEVVPLRPLGDGLYEARVAPPRPGPVNLYVESASLGLRPGTLPHITLRAVEP
ncbi:cytochrome D1 domain-containing protein [Craurococcus roseus]|uniref:Cytochrome D1 domain-containing protein n=1 Tax=Craurococcus roseus TaxID=77585 RepID=A0ABN1FZD3_9PROT